MLRPHVPPAGEGPAAALLPLILALLCTTCPLWHGYVRLRYGPGSPAAAKGQRGTHVSPALQAAPPTSHTTSPHPLQVDSEGRKFGKSTGGAIWLSAAKLSPYKFYQYLFATTDADVVKFLRMLTFLPLEEVAAVEAAMAAPEYRPNTAQRRLAEEVTR